MNQHSDGLPRGGPLNLKQSSLNRVAVICSVLTVAISAAAYWHTSKTPKLAATISDLGVREPFRRNLLQPSDRYTIRGSEVNLVNGGRAPSHDNWIVVSAPEGAWFEMIGGFGELVIETETGAFKRLGSDPMKLTNRPSVVKARLDTLAPSMAVTLRLAWAHDTGLNPSGPAVLAYAEEGIASVRSGDED